MDRGEQLRRIAEYAADQWGLITAAQAKRIGLNAVQLLRLAEAGLLENVGRGVYLLQAAGFPPHLEIKVAWLRLQPAVFASERSLGGEDSGVVSHASACQLHGLGDIPAPKAEISVPRRRTTTDPFVRLRTAQLESADITLVQGLPVTTARRTILDLLRSKTDGGHVGGVIADAERLDLVAIEDLQEAVRPFTRAYGLPTRATGGELIEHLVSQAGARLRSQEVARASEEGFTTAIELMAQSAAGPDLTADQAIRQAVQRVLHEQVVVPNAGLEEALRRIREQVVVPNAGLEEALRRIREQIAAPQPSSWRAIERLNAPNAAAARVRQAIEQARASNDRAARESPPDQPAQGASEDVQKGMSGKQDSA
ncbi:type IV toxin-antitoxin system AbiEi family antitoxin domain-containing protein [Streptomyces sp. NBC_01217]|uniref:type IV toxin-antitoxin system AbiEi family antitoxin domain-containing protein n=1 Tax=Streptomyces sp. NBC_01217 TaxID=2903779 RepID=UPI002E13E6F0|nr:type IV toxin-antitoxin system AbiEi family antitoxin domain-containing protein [Streptomyces sp. NBC_01217]